MFVSAGLSSSDAKLSRRHNSDHSLRLSLSDEASHEEIEYLSKNYPEYQDLSSEMKLAIFDFLQERITDTREKGEVIDPRITLLADEVAVNDEVVKSMNRIKDLKMTILHTACAIGDSWLVELLIKSGIDIHVPDAHNWTAYMVACANKQAACRHILREHMQRTGIYPGSENFLTPTGLVQLEGNPITIKPDGLTVLLTASDDRTWMNRVCPNHPISPTKKVFYYEITIIPTSQYG